MDPVTALNSPDEMPMIGTTDRKVFWIVFLVSLFMLSGLLTMVSKGAVALAAAVPVPFTVQTGTLNGTKFHLYPGLSQADNASPVGVTQMDCSISTLNISKSIPVPVLGNVKVNLSSGKTTPVTINGLTIDAASLGVDEAKFNSLSLSAAGNGLDMNAPTTTLTNATIASPYLIANSITLPGLSLTLSVG